VPSPVLSLSPIGQPACTPLGPVHATAVLRRRTNLGPYLNFAQGYCSSTDRAKAIEWRKEGNSEVATHRQSRGADTQHRTRLIPRRNPGTDEQSDPRTAPQSSSAPRADHHPPMSTWSCARVSDLRSRCEVTTGPLYFPSLALSRLAAALAVLGLAHELLGWLNRCTDGGHVVGKVVVSRG
jgi:hypothetical protein